MSPNASKLSPTPGQTVGPFFGYALPYDGGENLVPPHHRESVRLHGYVYDGDGDPIPDALLEIWQADQHGNIPRQEGSLHRDGYTFTGFGRAATDAAGHYQFSTVVPGYKDGSGKAPFIAAAVFSRGLMNKLHTRIYLPDHASRHAADPFLSSLEPEELSTVVAARAEDGSLQHDIHLQGVRETVFLAFD
ncbi:protocatechuate 3,4-dioxygenase subunit alpha [Arthrobacter castelli]|uniref:protocatechuate 3,4-dioxygenase subunit alpha n=1 Tax=Arthrobacter castelli TaxID=271431 RepID=UPI0004221E62|nr:protocatechuate 3,4-dioxygenase subunit alpha [Arthrobacter castelli]